jgi:hypothetical protein
MWYGHNLPYTTVSKAYISKARYAVGNKADEIKNKIAGSNSVTSLLNQSVKWGHIPNQKQFVESVQSMFYFLFKSHAAVALGSLYAMERWNAEINSKHKLADDLTLVDTIERLTAFCENIASGSAKY